MSTPSRLPGHRWLTSALLVGLSATAQAAAQTPDPTAVNANATLSYSTSFTDAGGDLTYNFTDNQVVTLVQGLVPLFDTALGTLERVSITLSGWRSLDFDCTLVANGNPGGCNARVDGVFVLDSVNNPVWSFLSIATINPRTADATALWPAPGTTQSALVYGSASTSVDITDPTQLLRHFTNATGSQPQVDFRLYFQSNDGGAFGYGGGAGITRMEWNGDATVDLTYHYTAPVPEPGTWAMWMLGVAALTQAVRRSRRRPQRS